MVAGSGRWRRTREEAGKGEGAHREDGDGEAKTGRRPTTRIGGGASRVGVGDGAPATPYRGGGAAEGSKDEGLEEGEASRHGEEHWPSTAFAAGLSGETLRRLLAARRWWPRVFSSLRGRGKRRRTARRSGTAGICDRRRQMRRRPWVDDESGAPAVGLALATAKPMVQAASSGGG
uniref:Uncharacterized protein n=1 Tax=Oryza sativa subsp. japonica TaxID=39947 RepID=Q69MK4_ORYSJ|nr:hypothetical protein [Oryza sativa Japonica Group]